jgi:hypothetical protein
MISWSIFATICVIGIAGVGMPLVIFLLRENIKEIRQGIITDLAHFFESGKDNRANDNDERAVESYRIIPSFEFVKYKYFLSRSRQPSGSPRSRTGQHDLAVWKFLLSMVPFVVIVIAFSCFTLSYYLTQKSTPGDVIENLFGNAHHLDPNACNGPGPDDDDCPPDWLRADDLAFLIITSFFGAYIASIRRFLRAVSNFDLGPLTFLRATDQMITAAAATAVLFIAFPSADFFAKIVPPAAAVLGADKESWLHGTFMPWIAVAFVIGMMPDVGILNLYDHVKLRYFKRHNPNILDQGQDDLRFRGRDPRVSALGP